MYEKGNQNKKKSKVRTVEKEAKMEKAEAYVDVVRLLYNHRMLYRGRTGLKVYLRLNKRCLYEGKERLLLFKTI